MTAWSSWTSGKLRELEPSECLELLRTRSVGRVAFCAEDGPVVLPVNYVVHEGDVVFRTSPHNSIARRLRAIRSGRICGVCRRRRFRSRCLRSHFRKLLSRR